MFDDVADGINPFDIGILIGIDFDKALLIDFNAGFIKIDAIGCRCATRCPTSASLASL